MGTETLCTRDVVPAGANNTRTRRGQGGGVSAMRPLMRRHLSPAFTASHVTVDRAASTVIETSCEVASSSMGKTEKMRSVFKVCRREGSA